MRVQLRVTVNIEDEEYLVSIAKERAIGQGGDPNMIATGGDALVEFFELIDDEGQPMSEGFHVENIEAVELCKSCDRRVHR